MSLRIDGTIFAFHFETPDDLLPASYPPDLVSELRRVSAQGPVGLLATVGPQTRTVDPRVIGFWLERARDPEIRIRAIAVVTEKLAIKIALTAFGKTCGALGLPLQVRHTSDQASARAWLQEALPAP